MCFLNGSTAKNPLVNAGYPGDMGSIPGLGRSPGGENANHPVFLPEESHGQRNLAGYSPWCLKYLDTTEQSRDNYT